MRVSVATVVAGRHEHLARQHGSLRRGERVPDEVVVVSMGDPGVADVVADGPLAARSRVLEVATEDGRLPLARARNLAVDEAWRRGADLVVLLDVDCLAAPRMLSRYAEAAVRHADAPAVLCGPVAYLPPARDPGEGYAADELAAARPHAARPAPAEGELLPVEDWRLFWSLSFAVGPAAWRALGGFDEAYRGYGGEDTDLGQRARAAGLPGWWVGGALALHQWHPVEDPPVRHLDDILRNGALFADRWGWWPMEGWLTAFEERGLVRRTQTGWEGVT
ncbi:glycosyltransferase family 2 protein [Nocardioides solisilvae]|uniref:glycosyltransferase family 2 protein n=1 Tax=Nocardioides solisilvae TaxID=1542435 RepID=UPI000D748029|nr:galactosyltransferase-related protein [Nocardioides solisilvae]